MTTRGEQLRDLTGKEKAAMLLITLGPERSAQIFKHLKEEEIEQLTLRLQIYVQCHPLKEKRYWLNFISFVLHSNI